VHKYDFVEAGPEARPRPLLVVAAGRHQPLRRDRTYILRRQSVMLTELYTSSMHVCISHRVEFRPVVQADMEESSGEIEDGQETERESLYTWNDNPYFGYCDTVEEADDLIQEYSYRTSTSFATVRATKGFGSFNLTGSSSTSLSTFSPMTVRCATTG